MRSNLNASKLRTIKLVGYVGKELVAKISNEDSARDPEDISAGVYGKVYDETDTEILDLVPTGGTDGIYRIKIEITAGITPGWYYWEGGVLDSAGDDEPRFRGPVHFRTY